VFHFAYRGHFDLGALRTTLAKVLGVNEQLSIEQLTHSSFDRKLRQYESQAEMANLQSRRA
jgi:hypothetical protein